MENIEPLKYIILKDGRILIVKQIIIQGQLYIARNINKESAIDEEICQSEIKYVVDEICKSVIVE